MLDMNTSAVRNVYSKNCVEGPFLLSAVSSLLSTMRKAAPYASLTSTVDVINSAFLLTMP